MNDLMMDLVSLHKRRKKKKLTADEAALFFLSCYDLDRFRIFALEEGLLTLNRTKAIHNDDAGLMGFAIDWLKGQLYGAGGDNPKNS